MTTIDAFKTDFTAEYSSWVSVDELLSCLWPLAKRVVTYEHKPPLQLANSSYSFAKVLQNKEKEEFRLLYVCNCTDRVLALVLIESKTGKIFISIRACQLNWCVVNGIETRTRSWKDAANLPRRLHIVSITIFLLNERTKAWNHQPDTK